MKPIIINIEWIKIIIEKGEEIKTIPEIQHPIQYNWNFSIKRKYYKKTDKEYQRRKTSPRCRIPKIIWEFWEYHTIVKQEPLLDLNY